MLDLMLTFPVPMSICSDAGGEFTVEVVNYLCRWLVVSMD